MSGLTVSAIAIAIGVLLSCGSFNDSAEKPIIHVSPIP